MQGEPFDPAKHIIQVQGGRDYLPVAPRVRWFREEHPEWTINTRILEHEVGQYAVCETEILNDAGRMIATGQKMEAARRFPDYLEKAATGSVGRALAMCGYGTQFAPELDEGERFADAPRDGRGGGRRDGGRRGGQGVPGGASGRVCEDCKEVLHPKRVEWCEAHLQDGEGKTHFICSKCQQKGNGGR